MSSSPTPSPSSPDTFSSSANNNSSSDSDVTGAAQYYNYLFLLLAVAFLIVFLLLLLLYFQRRRKIKNARFQQHGRAALVQDVSQLSPAAGLWSWRSPSEPSRRLDRIRSACSDSILEAGLDERGQAPPPYKTAAADRAPPMPRTETVRPPPTEAEGFLAMGRVPAGERVMCSLPPPDYRENAGPQEGLDVPARPDALVTVAGRLAEADLEEQPRQGAHASQIALRNVGRWGSMRRCDEQY